MNKRTKKKLITNVAAKILARKLVPEINVKITRPERKAFKRHHALVVHLVYETQFEYFN